MGTAERDDTRPGDAEAKRPPRRRVRATSRRDVLPAIQESS